MKKVELFVIGIKLGTFQIYIPKLSIGKGISYGVQEELLFLMQTKIKQILLSILMKTTLNL